MLARLLLAMGAPARLAAVCRGRGRGCQAALSGLSLRPGETRMNRQFARSGLGLIILALSSASAFAHHVMGGRTPATFGEGILSGFGHPVIGLDHFAAVWRSAVSLRPTGRRQPSSSHSCCQ
ncbi:MAG: HupE/UreJ family protein [Xanthobacteraceae bacterium]